MRVGLWHALVVMWWTCTLAVTAVVWMGWSWAMARGYRLHQALEWRTNRAERRLMWAKAARGVRGRK